MSNNEILGSAADQDLAKSDPTDDTKNVSENAALPVPDSQNTEQPTDSTTPSNTIDQTTVAAKKEVESCNESSNITETTTEPAGETIEKAPGVPEVQQQTIGAGDTCPVPRPDENANVQKAQEEIAAVPEKQQISLSEDKKNENEVEISKLKTEVQKLSKERDSLQKKLESTEKKLALLQGSYDSLMKGEGDEVMLRRMVDQLKGKLIQTSLQLEDRIRVGQNQEKQISALNSQVASLKEVESLTRSLLQIRNMEVKHLQAEVDDMEVRINEERERYNTMINKMDSAVKLNADLKKEYEIQLGLFRDLREKYEEKVTLLSAEKQALENSTQSVPK